MNIEYDIEYCRNKVLIWLACFDGILRHNGIRPQSRKSIFAFQKVEWLILPFLFIAGTLMEVK